MRYVNTRRVGNTDRIVVDFVDDDMRRRTIVVPFNLSDDATVSEVVEHVNGRMRMIPDHLDDGTGE